MRSDRLIRALIRLYPADFRARYGTGDARVSPRAHARRAQCVASRRVRSSNGRRGRASACAAAATPDDCCEASSMLGQDIRFRASRARAPPGVRRDRHRHDRARRRRERGDLQRRERHPAAAARRIRDAGSRRVVSATRRRPGWRRTPEFVDYQRDVRVVRVARRVHATEGNLATRRGAGARRTSPSCRRVLLRARHAGRCSAARSRLTNTSSSRRRSWSSATGSGNGGSAAIRRSSARRSRSTGRPRTVVGVMPPHFDYPSRAHRRVVADAARSIPTASAIAATTTCSWSADCARRADRARDRRGRRRWRARMMRDYAGSYDPHSSARPADRRA